MTYEPLNHRVKAALEANNATSTAGMKVMRGEIDDLSEHDALIWLLASTRLLMNITADLAAAIDEIAARLGHEFGE